MSVTTELPPLGALAVPTREAEPTWLQHARTEASAWVTEHGFPTRKEEDWRYTKLDALLATGYEPAMEPGSAVDPAWLDREIVDLGGARLVFVDGWFIAEASRLDGLPAGARIGSLAQVLAERPVDVRLGYEAAAAAPPHAFAALNAVFGFDGAVVELDEDVTLPDPVQLLFLRSGRAEASLASPRSVVRLAARSTATIVEEHRFIGGPAPAAMLTNSSCSVELGDGATLVHHVVQDEHREAFHLADLEVEQGPASTFTTRLFSLGAAVARRDVHVRLLGDGATVQLDGLYLPLAGQQHDHPLFIEHLASQGTSHQLYKGVMDGDGHGVFNGRVIVHADIVGTNADQSNHNLLLSRRAEADTRPRLEIFSEDVRATHGAAVGQLDDEQLFYLRSRGIELEHARLLLTEAFARQLVERVELPVLRAHLDERVTAHLAASLGAVAS